MQVKWHVAFCNVTITEYAGMTYRDYYASPANMLEAQWAAQAVAEKKFGVGGFIRPYVDTLSSMLAAYLGMSVVWPNDDELPYVDTVTPLLHEPPDAKSLANGDPRSTGLMGMRWKAWQYYRDRGYPVPFGGGGGNIITTAHEVSAGNILLWLLDEPEAAKQVLDAVTDADLFLRAFDETQCGATDAAYTGDDFSGLLSPDMYRRFAIPQYQRIFAGRSKRYMHSELLRAEHLRIAKDMLDITCFHGAGCKNLTLAEMYDIMGHRFWTQITPQELAELTPVAIREKVARYAECGSGYVQIYPGRGIPDANMEAAIDAAQQLCTGGQIDGFEE